MVDNILQKHYQLTKVSKCKNTAIAHETWRHAKIHGQLMLATLNLTQRTHET